MPLNEQVNRIKDFYDLGKLTDNYVGNYILYMKGKRKKRELTNISRVLATLPFEDRMEIYRNVCLAKRSFRRSSNKNHYRNFVADITQHFHAHVLD